MNKIITFAFLILIVCSCKTQRTPYNYYQKNYSIHATNFYMKNMKKNKKLWNEYNKAEQKIIENDIKESNYVSNLRKFKN
jgi:hypothetical protein